MNNSHSSTVSEVDNRLFGVCLVLLGLGWVSLQSLATAFTGSIGLYLSQVAFGSVGIGTIHIVIGIVLLSTKQLNHSLSFSDSVVAGLIAFVASSAALLYWEVMQSGVLTVEALISFPFFACYVAAWGFPLGFASTPTQRVSVLGGLCAIPAAMLVAIPVLLLINGGWLILLAMVSIPVILVMIPLVLLVVAPLPLAGLSARSHSATPT